MKKRLWRYMRPHAFWFLGSVLAGMGSSGLDALFIKWLQPLVDQVFVARNSYWTGLALIGLPLLFATRGLLNFASEFGIAAIANNICSELRRELFLHFQRLPAHFLQKQASSQLLSTVTYNAEKVSKALTEAVSETCRYGFLTITLMNLMFQISPALTLMFFSLMPGIILLFWRAGQRYRRLGRLFQKNLMSMTQLVSENLSNFKDVRILGSEEFEEQMFMKELSKTQKAYADLAFSRSLMIPATQTLGGLALSAMIYWATSARFAFSLSAGQMLALLIAMVTFLRPLKQLATLYSQWQEGMAAAEQVFEVLDQNLENQEGFQLKKSQGHIRFSNVSFAYGSDLILKNLSFEIQPGEMVGIVGPSGAGKSSVLTLLLRFFEEYSGDIFLDGINIKSLTLPSLRQQFGVVLQDLGYFNRTIVENLAGAQLKELSQNAIEKAALQAHALDFIQKLPQSWQTILGEKGANLSGGQRQRLAIARALLKDSPILLLDEATAALDGVSEQLIQETLESLKSQKTLLLVAHRLKTLQKADKILVLNDGELIDSGNYTQLLNSCPLFKALHDMQSRSIEMY